MDALKITIIIVNWNGKHLLEKCLASIAKNTKYTNYKLVVIDNGSSDGSVEFLEKSYPDVKLIKNNANLGFSRANNLAIEATESDYVFLLNNDTEVMEGWLSESVVLAHSDPRIGIVGSKILYMDMKPQYLGDRRIPHHGLMSKLLTKCEKRRDHVKEVFDIQGAAFLVRREAFDKVGLFDEGFYLYSEESDFCCRTRSAGYKVMYTPYSRVKHHKGGSSGESDHGYFHRHRSRVRFYLLNFSVARLTLQLFFEVPVILRSIVDWRSHLLFKAYVENLKNIKETWNKRRERKVFTFRTHALFRLP